LGEKWRLLRKGFAESNSPSGLEPAVLDLGLRLTGSSYLNSLSTHLSTLYARSIGMTLRALRLFAIACVIAIAPTAALPQSMEGVPERGSSSGSGAQSHAVQSRTRLITLGTAGGPLPRADRAQSSNVLIVNGTPYLIDAGDGVTRRLVQAGIDFRKVDHIFITHNHNDHMAGLATLLDSEWQFMRRSPINVYGPLGTEAVVKGAIQYMAIDADIRSIEGKTAPLSEVFVGHDLKPGLIYQDANVKVTAVENTHYHFPRNSSPYGKHGSYSYRFETPDGVFVFSGDTGPSQALTNLAKGADVLVSEVIVVEDFKQTLIKNGTWQVRTPSEQQATLRHLTEDLLTPEEVGKMATNAGVKTVILTHLHPTINDKDDYSRYAALVNKYYKGRVLVAKDLMQF
jgi:ribonuclease BN (tRNA processing enzyme)